MYVQQYFLTHLVFLHVALYILYVLQKQFYFYICILCVSLYLKTAIEVGPC